MPNKPDVSCLCWTHSTTDVQMYNVFAFQTHLTVRSLNKWWTRTQGWRCTKCIALAAYICQWVQGCPGGVALEECSGGICHQVPSLTSPGLLRALNATKEMQHEVATSPLQVMKLPWCLLFPNSVASLAVSTTGSCYGLCEKLGLVHRCS